MKKSVKIRRWLMGIGITLCLLAGLLIPVSFVYAQGVTISVAAPATVTLGDYFTANINISEVTNLDTALFNVVFDPAFLTIDNIAPGADITDGLIGTTTMPVNATNLLSPGTVRILVSPSGTPGISGSGYLCQIRFHAIGAGSSNINLANYSLSDNLGNAIVATWTGTTVNVTSPALPSVAFYSTNYSVGEGAGNATITVNLFAASTQTVTVGYATSDGTATAGSDYTAASGTLSFNPGQTSRTFNVSILEDSLAEGNETVNLALSNPTNATLGTPNTAVLTIIDNDEVPPIGGEAFPPNKLLLLAPWTALLASIIAGAVIFVRRCQAKS